MGGLAGVRRPIIRTTGDVTGGGGRSVMPTRRRRIGQRGGLQRFYGPPEREVPAGGWAPPPPGGGYSGGVVPRFQTGRTVNPRAGGESAMQRQRRMQWNNRTTPIPAGWGAYGAPFGQGASFPSPPGGWQEGGQFPEAAFPVENQLSDESPWYPDEEVGFEEAAPMQGGFDIFGRSGG